MDATPARVAAITAHFSCPVGPVNADVFFEETSYNVQNDGNGCENFFITVNMSTPVHLFYGARFGLEWDCTLFYIRDAWTQNNGHGRLYNGTSPNPNWSDATKVNVSLAGSSCPNIGAGDQGRANIVVDWSNYWQVVHNGKGVNVTAPPGSPPYPAEAELIYIGWRTAGPGCWGKAVNNGSTDIRFVPTLKLMGYDGGIFNYSGSITWHNTSVTVGP
jgi:hypothetical protein